MTYFLGKRSLQELEGVHPDLVACVEYAIDNTPVDFAVHDGNRTKSEQYKYYKSGASHTMNSKHLPQEDGYGHAVDLVPYINGKLRWEMPPIYQIAYTMQEASHVLDVPLRWGGFWAPMVIGHTAKEYKMLLDERVERYISKRVSQNKRPFVDGCHFEVMT